MARKPVFSRHARAARSVAALVSSLLFAAGSVATSAVPRAAAPHDLPRSTPEAQGIASADVLAFVRAADEQIDSMNGLVVVRHGHVVAEGYWSPYDAKTPHALYSLTKSFTSTAVGLAISEGKLHLEDTVLSFFPDEAPAEPSQNLKALRVRDLLTMTVGHHAETAYTPDRTWVASFLAQPVEHKPGTFFLYNTPASNTLSSIVQKATGMTTEEYLRPRLFEPLGIGDPDWPQNPQGASIGGYGLKLRTIEIAKFGQLLLQKGKWEGRQLVPSEWLAMATSRQASNGSSPTSDWDQGYGFQFWRCRHGAFRGDGAFGQYCIVLPEQDAVVAINSGVRDMQAVMNLVWERLLPAMKAGALPADASAARELEQTLAKLEVRTQSGDQSSPAAAKVAGKRFVFPANDQKIESIALESGSDGAATLVVTRDGTEQRVAVGRGAWAKGRLAYGNWPEQPIAASGAWTSPDTYRAKVVFYEEPFVLTVDLHFAGDRVTLGQEMNVFFGPTKRPELVGTLAG
jgi:CubicO group peptidase (beta-lactamase class C family)